MKNLCILGSTGSVGQTCCRVLRDLQDCFRVVALTAGSNFEALGAQTLEFRPQIVSVANEEVAEQFREYVRAQGYRERLQVVWGSSGMVQAATHPAVDLVVSASHGVTGLAATYRALEAGKKLALANKEILVAAGELVTRLAGAKGIEILPVDSEHSAIHQCLRAGRRAEVKGLILTGSGGPFRNATREDLDCVAPHQALRHPIWKMGDRITIDSATLMNKGFEVIEAHWLFGVCAERIRVLIHPQSIVHSMVEFSDGAVIAQLGVADMQLPIRYALTYPERVTANGETLALSWAELGRLEFSAPDTRRFPCLELAREALRAGGSMPCVMNAVDEVAVEAFLSHGLRFSDIPRLVERVMGESSVSRLASLEDVWDCDAEARSRAREILRREFSPRGSPPC